jgi:shikimate dehydrogenase
MTAGTPLLVVALPGRSVGALREQRDRARAAGADLAEVRVDRLPPAETAELERLFPSDLPLIATLRSRREGGEGPDEPSERARALRRLGAMPFAFVDLEWENDRALVGSWPGPARLVLSRHLSDLHHFERVVRGAPPTPVPPSAWQKTVVPASLAEFWRHVLPRLHADRAGAMRIVHTTGPSGPLLRIWGRRFGWAAVYCAMPRSTDGAELAVEPSQVPVDELKRAWSAPGAARSYALLGHPVDRSLSPAIHARWLRARGLPGVYVAIDVGTEPEFRTSLAPLFARGFHGLNVTVPWKEVALEEATHPDAIAERCGAANCLTFDGTEVEATNTDYVGFRRRLLELRGEGRWDGASAVVVGSGGAARAALAALADLGVPSSVLARRADRAEAVGRPFGAETSRPRAPRPATLVVHATSFGMREGSRLEVPIEELVGASTVVLDFVYRPRDSQLAELTARRGGRYEDGSRLLVYQAAASFGIWWGAAPTGTMEREALEAVGCAA